MRRALSEKMFPHSPLDNLKLLKAFTTHFSRAEISDKHNDIYSERNDEGKKSVFFEGVRFLQNQFSYLASILALRNTVRKEEKEEVEVGPAGKRGIFCLS